MDEMNKMQDGAVASPVSLPKNGNQQADIARFTKKKSKKKMFFIIVAIIIAVVAAVTFLMPKSTAVLVSVMPLQRGELVKMINLSGMVESESVTWVYSSQMGTVESVHVKVGTRVDAGDILAQLDTSDIELSIAQQQATLNNTIKSNEIRLQMSEQDYQDLLADLDNNMDSALVNAANTLARAQKAFTDARHDMDEHRADLNYADEVMDNRERALNRARSEFERAETAWKNAGKPDSGDLFDEMNAKDWLYQEAYEGWSKANDLYGADISSFTRSYRQAQLDFQAAQKNYDIAKQNADRQLEKAQLSIEQNKISSDVTASQLALQNLRQNLLDSTVKAPVAGTITAVYARKGASGGGLLFIIEDVDQLVVKTAVLEYDVGSVVPGLPAVVKSDATGEEEFEGEVLRSAPAAVKMADGSARTVGNVEFETDVALLSRDSALRIGMNVRLSLILEKKENVFSVPYDAVFTSADGQDVIYLMKTDEEGKTTAEEVVVTVGMETDFRLEVQSEKLTEGDQVITSTEGLVAGMEVISLAGLVG